MEGDQPPSFENHLRVVGPSGRSYTGTLEGTTNIRIYGTPSTEILEMLSQAAGSGVPTTVLPEHLGGFTVDSRLEQVTPVMPGVGPSLFPIAGGAILRYAVTIAVTGVALRTVGLILMIVGGVGLVISGALLLAHGRYSSTHADPPREPVVDGERYYD